MSYSFNEGDKEVREFAETIPFGVSKVSLLLAEAGETEAGKSFIELTILSADGIEDKARLWFVGGAANISFNTLRQIIVHNCKTDEEKADAKEAVDAAKDTDEIVDILTAHCINGELWFTKYYDPTRTYTTENGTFRSVNKNVYGYEPKLKPELMPTPKAQEGQKNVDPNDYPDDNFIPKSADAAASAIPSKEDWAK